MDRHGAARYAHRTVRTLAAGLVGLALAAPATHAQTIVGTVVDDDTGESVASAEVALLDPRAQRLGYVVADSTGAFRIRAWQAGTYRIQVSRLGYATATTDTLSVDVGETVTVRIRLGIEPLPIAPITVTVRSRRSLPGVGLVAFYDRVRMGRLLGLGKYLTPDEIAARPNTSLLGLLSSVPGVRISPHPDYPGRYLVFMSRSPPSLRNLGRVSGRCPPPSASVAGYCTPLFYLNGMPVRVDWDDFESFVGGATITALEVYRSAAELPAEFSGSAAQYGVVVVWTR